mmetsp:Transcript_25650/g.60445  ORF Transcript_25650/g.60445 Transcript_25650/m.60445 type:complete len:84 (-) Transcript_25650:3726-3977(-)
MSTSATLLYILDGRSTKTDVDEMYQYPIQDQSHVVNFPAQRSHLRFSRKEIRSTSELVLSRDLFVSQFFQVKVYQQHSTSFKI